MIGVGCPGKHRPGGHPFTRFGRRPLSGPAIRKIAANAGRAAGGAGELPPHGRAARRTSPPSVGQRPAGRQGQTAACVSSSAALLRRDRAKGICRANISPGGSDPRPSCLSGLGRFRRPARRRCHLISDIVCGIVARSSGKASMSEPAGDLNGRARSFNLTALRQHVRRRNSLDGTGKRRFMSGPGSP